jgi:hypothetical protein
MNIYINPQSDFIVTQFKTRAAADLGRCPGRIACVKVTIDCEEGEGLRELMKDKQLAAQEQQQ